MVLLLKACINDPSYNIVINKSWYKIVRKEKKQTLKTGFPDGVGVAETRDDVVADREGEPQLVRASFLQSEPYSL